MLWERRLPRIAYHAPVHLLLDGGPRLPGRTRNVSERGLFVETAAPVEIGSAVQLELEIGSRPATLSGRVAWRIPTPPTATAPGGVGIELVDLSDEDAELIRQLVGESDEGTHPVRLWFGAESPPMTSRATLTDRGIVVSSALPFLRPDVPVRFRFTSGDADATYHGRVGSATIVTSSGTPRLQFEIVVATGDAMDDDERLEIEDRDGRPMQAAGWIDAASSPVPTTELGAPVGVIFTGATGPTGPTSSGRELSGPIADREDEEVIELVATRGEPAAIARPAVADADAATEVIDAPTEVAELGDGDPWAAPIGPLADADTMRLATSRPRWSRAAIVGGTAGVLLALGLLAASGGDEMPRPPLGPIATTSTTSVPLAADPLAGFDPGVVPAAPVGAATAAVAAEPDDGHELATEADAETADAPVEAAVPAPARALPAAPPPAPLTVDGITARPAADGVFEVILPVRGSLDDVRHYALANPDGVALTVPGGRMERRGKVALGVGPIERAWIRTLDDGALQIRVFTTGGVPRYRVEPIGGALHLFILPSDIATP